MAGTPIPQLERLNIPLLSGAPFPDWSVVTSDEARASLNDTLGRLRMTKRWVGITEPEDKLRRAILDYFVATGHAPNRPALSVRTGFSEADLSGLLSSLERRDLIVFSRNGEKIEAAYPFTDRKTEHRVIVDDLTLRAMCAIDALGVGAMLNRDTVIHSKCRYCGCKVKIETEQNGLSIASVSPENAVVWSGIQDIDGCAADTQCSVMAYFCSDDHLAIWHEDNEGEPQGHRLSIDQGLEAGAAIFIPFLATA